MSTLLKAALLWIGLPLAALAALAACAPTATLNALAPRSTHVRHADLAYGPLARQRLDVYVPTAAAPAGGHAVVVFFHGGSWNRGERAGYRFVGEALAARGIVTMLADYRLYPEVRYPDFLRDSAQALAWGFAHAARFGGNPQRLHVMGHSAGAYNAAMLALDARWLGEFGLSPDRLAGFIGLAGPYDFLPMTNPDTRPVFFHPNYPDGSQPIAHVSRTSPRAFIGAPAQDALVDPVRNSQGLAQRLAGAGVEVTLRRYERTSHTTLIAAFGVPLRWLAPVADDVAAFVQASGAR